MRLQTLLAGMTLALTATAAFAATMNVASVTLVTPVAVPNTAKIALNTGWNCTDSTCTAMLDRKSPALRDCRALVRELGPISAYSVGTKSLDAASLATCNAPAR
jgi:poly-gamma-glutamate capsule biosynthesis protein CapA/YwtB (metallophosphatase superfamily)